MKSKKIDEITSETSEEDSDVEVIVINLKDDSIEEYDDDKKNLDESLKTRRFIRGKSP